jgi:hypothetical protein
MLLAATPETDGVAATIWWLLQEPQVPLASCGPASAHLPAWRATLAIPNQDAPSTDLPNKHGKLLEHPWAADAKGTYPPRGGSEVGSRPGNLAG